MGNHFTNWNTGCDHGCAEQTNACGCETTPAVCACEANNGYAAGCSCNLNPASAAGGCRGEHANEAHIFYEACDGYKEITVTGACQKETAPGRVLDVHATLLNVCPGRRSALGLTLTEVDGSGTEHARGFRAVSVPAHHGKCNRDVQLETIRFLLPEDMSLQRRRHFICRMSHHYLDSDGMWG